MQLTQIVKATCVLLLAGAWLCPGYVSAADKPQGQATQQEADDPAKPRMFSLPGLVVNLDEQFVDVEARVCLDQGYLELIACTKGTKEHESIVAIEASPRHVHAGLLLLGMQNGNPAMQRQIGEEEKRWVHLPPRGDALKVSLVIADKQGQPVEKPIRDFVIHVDELREGPMRDAPRDPVQRQPADGRNKPDTAFPDVFVFAGSHIVDAEDGSTQYLADRSGHVISVVTFGDELICLPGKHSADNDALVWQVNPALLPPVGTKVMLRLRPHKPPAAAAE